MNVAYDGQFDPNPEAWRAYLTAIHDNDHLRDVWITKAKTHCEGLRIPSWEWVARYGEEYDVDTPIIEAARNVAR